MTIQDVENLHYISNETINKLLKKGLLKKSEYDEEGDYIITLSKFMRKDDDDDDYDYDEGGYRKIYIVPEYSENPSGFSFYFDDHFYDACYHQRLKNGEFENEGKHIYLDCIDEKVDETETDMFYYWEFEEFWKPYLTDNNFKRIKI